jgi:hypothetical protein
MTELNESEIRKMPFFVTWHTMFQEMAKSFPFDEVHKKDRSFLHR